MIVSDSALSRICCLSCALLLLATTAFASNRRTPVVEEVAKAGPAVVNIRTEQIVKRQTNPFFGGSLFDEFFGQFAPQPAYATQALGSGVVIDPSGLVLTNAHVIARASRIFVALPDRSKELEATLVGSDEQIDLAVVRLPKQAKPYPYLPLQAKSDLLVGETVIAIGNPLGLGSSITTGVISGALRALSLEQDYTALFIQTDALINPGNSGGPLINLDGELIGINTAIARKAQGIGFAIPAEVAHRVLPDLVKYGRLRNSFFGVVPGPTGKAFAESRGFGGVLVTELANDSPAVKAGLQLADVILALDEVPVETPDEFLNFLHSYPPGSQVQVRLLRGLKEQAVTLKLAAYPSGFARDYAWQTFGFKLIEQGGQLRVDKIAPDSPAAKIGLQRGDLLAEVAGTQVKNLKDWRLALEANYGRQPLKFLVVRQNQGYYIQLP